jgi:hypothetical protein
VSTLPNLLLSFPLFPGLPRNQITAIFQGTFKPEQLYKLHHLHGYDEEDKAQEFCLEGGKLLIKDKNYIKDFGNTPAIWQQGFLNYSLTMVAF